MSYNSRPYYAETYTIFVEPIRDPSPIARTFNIDKTNRPLQKSLFNAFAYGLGAGLVGITATGITQAVEECFTGRPAIRVPGESIIKFFIHNFGRMDFFHKCIPDKNHEKGKRRQNNEEEPTFEDEGGSEPSNLTTEPASEGGEYDNRTVSVAKWATYFGQGIMLGGVRGILSYYGARGFVSDLVFLGFTSSVDRCPFWGQVAENLPLSQIVLDSVPELIHQAVYAFVTGFLCDHWVN